MTASLTVVALRFEGHGENLKVIRVWKEIVVVVSRVRTYAPQAAGLFPSLLRERRGSQGRRDHVGSPHDVVALPVKLLNV